MWSKIPGLLERHWWALPALSGVLLILSFHPFDLWPLGFVALVPAFYFAAHAHSGRRAFWGGCVAGALFAGSVCYFTVVQFHWLPQTHLFVALVHALFIPIAALGAVQWGATLWCYQALRPRGLLSAALVGAALYALAEMLLYALFGGYYFAMVAYLATPLPALMSLAALGGAFLVSFIIAWAAVLLAEAVGRPRGEILRAFVPAALVLLAFYGLSQWSLAPGKPLRTLSVALIQGGEGGLGFGTAKSGSFSFPALGEALKAASSQAPDLVIYPFSPVEGALYRGKPEAFNKPILVVSEPQFGAWLKGYVPASSTVMFWNSLYEGGAFYNSFEFWRAGALESEYRKRKLFPFLDYTPAWSAGLGLYSTSVDFSPGTTTLPTVGGLRVGALLCSEIQQQGLARADAAQAPVIISAGSEAVFVDDVASSYSLKAAQFRAAENGIPVVRSNLLGPSALIGRDGSIVAQLPRGRQGSIGGSLELYEPSPTLYNRTGGWPVALLVAGVLAAALWRKRSLHVH